MKPLAVILAMLPVTASAQSQLGEYFEALCITPFPKVEVAQARFEIAGLNLTDDGYVSGDGKLVANASSPDGKTSICVFGTADLSGGETLDDIIPRIAARWPEGEISRHEESANDPTTHIFFADGYHAGVKIQRVTIDETPFLLAVLHNVTPIPETTE